MKIVFYVECLSGHCNEKPLKKTIKHFEISKITKTKFRLGKMSKLSFKTTLENAERISAYLSKTSGHVVKKINKQNKEYENCNKQEFFKENKKR